MANRKKTRVGLVMDADTWVGGRNYIRNLLIAFAQLPHPEIEPVIFTGTRDGGVLAGLPPVSVIQNPLIDRRTLPWVIRRIAAKVSGRDWMLHRLMKREGIDAIYHWGQLLPDASIPTAGWIADFQHLHLPAFFSAEEQRQRDRSFMEMCKKCDKVIVSSECARADLQAFAPQYADKAEVLHFVASPADRDSTPCLADLQQTYAFEGPYFLLPNQFWAHKNHRVVITALKLLKERNQRVQVLATGSTGDYRQPDFFDSIMKYAKECDVFDRFRVLGLIPFDDLSGLMLHAVALVNPSLFEGWSTSVEESKSLGKRILLSDIPVHREQAPSGGVYFPPDDAESLAQCLLNTLDEFNPAADALLQQSARTNLAARQLQFAETFQRILLSIAHR